MIIEKYYNKYPLAIHKTWRYITKEQWEELKILNPEISLTFNF